MNRCRSWRRPVPGAWRSGGWPRALCRNLQSRPMRASPAMIPNPPKFSLKLLFRSYRRIATPLLWVAFFAESLTFMTYSAWLAVILEQAGLSPRVAALTFSYGAFAAVAAILAVWPAD